MPLLYDADFAELAAAWKNRSNAVFQKKITDDFVSLMLDRADQKDFKAELLQAIKYAREPKDLYTSFGLCFNENHVFYAEGFGNRRMTIKQVLYRTDALQQIAAFIGRDIKLRPVFDDGMIFIQVEYWPSYAPAVPAAPVAHINNPEDE